ncbi:hypothetical protein EV359DRAFT_68078 [Lentinula novae-zelandiae]|nr:hypothetical protein EV359DRAFT_68078 [Lentinula novae-zelandiae]
MGFSGLTLPYHGAGWWEDTVPALPSLNELTQGWEQLMIEYIHYLADMPLLGPPTRTDIAVGVREDTPPTELAAATPPPLFLPKQDLPDSPSSLPVLLSVLPFFFFGSVAPLVMDLTTGNDDNLYESGHAWDLRIHLEPEQVGVMDVDQEVLIKEELSVV